MGVTWYPVKEKLPDNFTVVIGTMQRAGENFTAGCFRSGNRWFDHHKGALDAYGISVVAWTQLPEPYNPDDDENRPSSDDDLIRRGDVLKELKVCVEESKEAGLDYYIDAFALRLRIQTMEAYKYKQQCSNCVLYDSREGRCYSDESEYADSLVRDTKYCEFWKPYWSHHEDTDGEEVK